MSRTTGAADPFIARIPFARSGMGELTRAFRMFTEASIRRWQKRKTIARLSELSDCELHDIGVRRADIPRVAEELVNNGPSQSRHF